MPSEDPIRPETNKWLNDLAPSSSTPRTTPGSSPASTTASGAGKTTMSASIQRIAHALGKTPEEMAAAIPEDTIRRTKFPVIRVENEDGTVSFKEPPGIIEGQKPLIAVDRDESGREEAPKLRDAQGRYTK